MGVMKRRSDQQRQEFLLSFFSEPWFNHKCVSVGNFKLLQAFNPVLQRWVVSIYPFSHYHGEVHEILEVLPYKKSYQLSRDVYGPAQPTVANENG